EVGKIEARVWMDVSEEMAATGLSRGTLRTLVETYGRAYPRVLELGRKLPDGFERLCPSNPEIVAQLHHALREEQAVSLQDVLLRRTGIGQSRCQGLDCAEPIAARMAELGGWTRRRLDAELEAYSQHVERSRRFRQRAWRGGACASLSPSSRSCCSRRPRSRPPTRPGSSGAGSCCGTRTAARRTGSSSTARARWPWPSATARA